MDTESKLYLYHVSHYSSDEVAAFDGDLKTIVAMTEPEVVHYWADDVHHALEQFKDESSHEDALVVGVVLKGVEPYDPNNPPENYVSKAQLDRAKNDD